MKIKTFSLVLLAILIAIGAGTFIRWQVKAQKKPHPAFTFVSKTTVYDLENGKQSTDQNVRYASSTGSYREIQTRPDGKIREYFFQKGVGHFNVNHEKRQLVQNKKVSPNVEPPSPSTAEELRSNPRFQRTEAILGYTAYVHRIMNEETGEPLVDIYMTEELGDLPIKVVEYSRGNVKMLIEPISVILGEPDPSLLREPGYPKV